MTAALYGKEIFVYISLLHLIGHLVLGVAYGMFAKLLFASYHIKLLKV